MSFDLQLAGQRALVTGGTRGVGAAVVQGLHDAGVQVMATARSVPGHAPEGVRYVAADLSTAEGAAKVAQSVLQQWGGIDQVLRARDPAPRRLRSRPNPAKRAARGFPS